MRYVIIGNSAAGNAAACAIRARDAKSEVLVLSDEPYPAYYRPLMPFFIDNRITYQAIFQDKTAGTAGVEVRLGTRVEEITPDAKSLTLRGGEIVPYDRLLIGTGASAMKLSIPGLQGSGVYALRTMADAQSVKAHAENAKRVVIIGGGRVGMKAAMAISRLGLDVAVIEQDERLVPFQFDREAAEILSSAVQAQGIKLYVNQAACAVERQGQAIRRVVLNSHSLDADFIVSAVGISPNVDLARTAGLAVKRGIVVDSRLRTSASDVYAAGDVVETVDLVTGESIVPATWTSAVETGRVAGHNMAGGDREYAGTLAVLNSFVLAGIPTVSVGLIHPAGGQDFDVYAQRRGNEYRKLVLQEGRLVGALMVGNIEGAGLYTALIKNRAYIDASLLDRLTGRRPSYAGCLQRAALA
jgi:NAD(P)H-nitrite reductase large subunit